MAKPRTAAASVHLLDDHRLGFEARAVADDHLPVKLWLRLLSCSTQIEQVIRNRLRLQFGTTLPRFDYLAQLERHPQGLKMNQLSRYLMVTGGNVTGLTDQLVAEGHVERVADEADRRAALVRLTPAGRAQFLAMAQEHESWLNALFAGAPAGLAESLYAQLGQLRVHLSRSDPAAVAAPVPPLATPVPSTPIPQPPRRTRR